MAVPVWRRGSPRLAERLREASGHLRGWSGAPWNASLPIWRYRHSGSLLQPASPCFGCAAPTCGAGFKRRQSAVPQVRAMPYWQTYGPARWGRRSSYGNGFAIFSRYITEPRDLPSEASHPTPDIRLFALIWAIVSPWKGISEPSSLSTVIYRKFSSIPLPCPKRQGDAGGRRRAIAGLHGAVPPGCAAIRCGPGEPPIDAPAARASQGGRPVPAAEPGERRDRAAGTCLTCEKAESEN